MIYKIPVPTPYDVGPVNSYLIKSKPYTLLDPGPETAEAVNFLKESLSRAGVKVKEIERVVLTHGHTDHCGLAKWAAEEAGAKIYVHEREIPKFRRIYDYIEEKMPFLLEAGMPPEWIREIRKMPDPLPRPELPKEGVITVQGGEILEMEEGSLQILHLPGHSSGHICLYDEKRQNFFSGDFLLKHISPNPLIEAVPENPTCRLETLRQYLDGLNVLEKLAVRVTWPGHGENINEYRATIAKAKKHHKHRLEVVLSVLDNKSMSTFQAMQIIYPDVKNFEIYLGISEVLAHLDYLSAEGKVTCENRDGVLYYRRNNTN